VLAASTAIATATIALPFAISPSGKPVDSTFPKILNPMNLRHFSSVEICKKY
jgi:hypothetical protein